MGRYVPSSLLIGLLVLAGSARPSCRADEPLVRVQSPNGQVRIELVLQRHQEQEAIPHWSVHFKDKPIILASRLTVDLAEGSALGGSCTVESVETHARHERYTMFPGKRRHVLDHCAETVVVLRERTPPRRRWELVFRAYNDGAAFRYRFPAQEGWPRLLIAGERTAFTFPDDAQATTLPLNGFTTSHEKLYQKKQVTAIPKDWLLGLPLLVECPGRGWAAVTEANLTDYAGMYLARAGDSAATLTSRLSPLPREPKLAVKASLPHASPWRVVLLAEDAPKLIESDLVLNLNEPCALADTSWIKPGKTTFPWWNGFHLENISFKPGLNTATMKHYIDFCAEAGIPYHSLDGIDNIGWYGCQIGGPHKPGDLTKAVPAIDMPELLRYARDKGVRLRLWMHWKDVERQMEQAFPLYRSWGIEGVMLDFMDRDDQEMVVWLRKVLQKAAENKLTVTLHGVSAPTGLERTYPHLLTHEGVLNLEYDKWSKVGCPPAHQVTVAFTRMLAGPLDFHQGSFRGVEVEAFKPRDKAPLVMGTPSRTLASYVVYQNHLSMVADYPAAYRGHPGLPMLVRISTTWDDTKALKGAVGEYVVVARRHGADWYVGAMNDHRPRLLDVPLRFLGPGRYRAEINADDPRGETSYKLAQRTEEVTAQDVLKISLASAGGYMVRLTPLAKESPKKAQASGSPSARAEQGTFDSNGVKIHYSVQGEGEPVLLIHGFAVNKEIQWGLPGIIKELAKTHRVIAYDNRGHGKSGKPTDPAQYGLEMVEDAVRLLDHLKIKKAHVVGYSMGAIITGKLMMTHPDRLLSATLGGYGVVREGEQPPPFVTDLVESLEKGKGIGPLLEALTPAGQPKPPKVAIEQTNRMLIGDNGKALAAVVRGWKELAISDEQLKANKVPALALIGERDPLKKSVDDIKDRTANLQVVVIGGTDHMTAFISPRFLNAINKFLDEHAQKAKRREKVPTISGEGKSQAKLPAFIEVDYAKMDRTIAKEPKYNAQPRYALFLFDPKGKFRVWAVLDKSKADAPHYDVLYFDKNGNGDLTEAGERFTGALDEKKKNLLIRVGELAVPHTKLVHTDLKFGTVEGHGYKGYWFSMKWNGSDPINGGYTPFREDCTAYSTSAKTAPVLRPTILGSLSFLTPEELVLPVGGAKDVQLIAGYPGSGPDTLCAVHENFLIPGKDRIIATLIAKDVAGGEVRAQTEIKKHC